MVAVSHEGDWGTRPVQYTPKATSGITNQRQKGEEERIEGVIKRYQADFHSPAPFSAAMRECIFAFQRFLIPGGMPLPVREESDAETEAADQKG